MTCIVGVEHNGKVYMGGDAAGTAGNMTQRTRNDKKVFVRDGFIIGFAGSFRMGQLMQHKLILPTFNGGNLASFMVNEFVNSLKECLKSENNHKGEELLPMLLVGHRGKLFDIQGDYQVGETTDGFDAIGSGADLALGSMHSNSMLSPDKRILQALNVSSKGNASVRPPFTILSV